MEPEDRLIHKGCTRGTTLIFILHGFAPNCTDGDITGEAITHFPQAALFLNDDIKTGAFGIERTVAGQRLFFETPENYFAWAKRKGLPIDPRIVAHFEQAKAQATPTPAPAPGAVSNIAVEVGVAAPASRTQIKSSEDVTLIAPKRKDDWFLAIQDMACAFHGEHPFTLEVVELGTDEDGDLVTSCAVRPQDAREAAKGRKPRAPAGGNQKAAWDWLEPEIKRHGSVTVDEAVQEIGRRLSVPEDRRGERARLAIDGLRGRGLLECLDGILTFPIPIPVPTPHSPIGGNGEIGKTGTPKFPIFREIGETGNDGSTALVDDFGDFDVGAAKAG